MQLRVLSYNVHKCIGGVDRRYQPQRIAETIAHYAPDVVMLQEVDHGAKRSNGDQQTHLLAELCGLSHHTWFPNVEVSGGGQYGNAVLSRWPIVETSNIDLTVPWKKRRSVLHAEIRLRSAQGPGSADDVDRTLHVFNMHLGLARYERHLQLARFLACHPFAGLHQRTPLIVGGDFNDVYGGLGKLLAPAGFVGPAQPPRTFPAWAPLRALDSLYVRGDAELHRVFRGEIAVATRASDHLPIIAELTLAAGRAG